MAGSNHDEDPVLDVVLDEIKQWAATLGSLDVATTLSIHAKSAAILTVAQIALFCVVKITTHSWACAQLSCLLPLIAAYVYAGHIHPTRRAATGGPLPLNYATLQVPAVYATVGAVPFVLIVGIPKASGVDLGLYAAAAIGTLAMIRFGWNLAVRRMNARR